VRAAYVLVLLVATLSGLVPVALADELVVDDADPGVLTTGSWQASTSTPGFYGDGYLFHAVGGGNASVRWPFPSDAASGRYRVFARWTGGANRASTAVYEVTAAGGTTKMTLDQRTGGGKWRELGNFAFGPGQGDGVVLSAHADGAVIADAVAWVGPLNADEPEHSVELGELSGTTRFHRAVDAGDEPWRLDPVEAARADTALLGFDAHDSMQLVKASEGSALVRAQHAGTGYDISLIQPARLGPTGVWVVVAVKRGVRR